MPTAKQTKSSADKSRLKSSQSLDRQYASAADFDRAQFNKWLDARTVVFTKRTERPKLGYLIHLLNEAGIPSIEAGSSWHGPLLRVAKEDEERAWALLSTKMAPRSRKTIDDIEDDDPRFFPYRNVQPDTDLWG